ncbi:MAG TPA: hypothetical protein VFB28_10050 [Terriglobales bacterium]|nr:hypothetical protein [Terriglobales bacterium]
MEIDDLSVTLLELKYCERCGGLWLREKGCEESLCQACSTRKAEFADVGRMCFALRTTINVDGEGREVFVMCGAGGNA